MAKEYDWKREQGNLSFLSESEALTMAAALERALSDIPDKPAAKHDENHKLEDENSDIYDWFAGQQADIKELIKFFRGGGDFTIQN